MLLHCLVGRPHLRSVRSRLNAQPLQSGGAPAAVQDAGANLPTLAEAVDLIINSGSCSQHSATLRASLAQTEARRIVRYQSGKSLPSKPEREVQQSSRSPGSLSCTRQQIWGEFPPCSHRQTILDGGSSIATTRSARVPQWQTLLRLVPFPAAKGEILKLYSRRRGSVRVRRSA